MVLHVINASPSSAAFRDCLRVLRIEDALVLMGDGAFAALADSVAQRELLATGVRVHLLARDAAAAGITIPAQGIALIDMDGFVTLTEQYSRQLCWF